MESDFFMYFSLRYLAFVLIKEISLENTLFIM